MENGRIIIDPHNFNVHGTPGPGLGLIESGAASDSRSSDDGSFTGIHNVICRSTRKALQKYQNALEKVKQGRGEDQSDGCKLGLDFHMHIDPELTLIPVNTLSPKQRLLCTPVIRGYCLAFKTWGKILNSNTTSFVANMGTCSSRVLYRECFPNTLERERFLETCPSSWIQRYYPRFRSRATVT